MKTITCKICEFETTSNKDMIEHLAKTQKYPEENCRNKVEKMKEDEISYELIKALRKTQREFLMI